MQLRHHRVFQACPKKLIGGAENFRSDKPGHIVNDHPRTGLLPDVSCQPVVTGLQGHHVHAFVGMISEGRPLAGFKVEPLESF